MLEKNSDSEVHIEKVETRATASIAFGLERIGLIAVRAPILSCIVLVGLIIAAIFGIQRIKIDDSLSQLFRSNSKDYKQYEAENKRFPASVRSGPRAARAGRAPRARPPPPPPRPRGGGPPTPTSSSKPSNPMR